jgi:hypothetical protein
LKAIRKELPKLVVFMVLIAVSFGVLAAVLGADGDFQIFSSSRPVRMEAVSVGSRGFVL